LLRNWNTEHGNRSRKERRDIKSKAKKTLLFQFSLNEDLKDKYRRSKNQQKKYLSELIRGRLLKKYKLLNRARTEFQIQTGANRFKKGSMSYRLRAQIWNFYERDENSKLTPGIKETVTKKGVKKQGEF
jgi:hypothetical protein